MGLLLIYDIYGTLADIHTDEMAISLWRTMQSIIALKCGTKPIFAPSVLRKKFFDYIKDEEEKQRALSADGEKFVEFRMENVFARLIADCGGKCDADEILRIMKVFRLLSIERIGIYKGIRDMLIEQKKQGFELAILSNAQRCFVEEEFPEILNCFDHVFISSDYLVRKPSHVFMSKLLNAAGRKPSEAVMIGNSAHDDMRMAYEMGIRTIYMNSDVISEPVPAYADAVVVPENVNAITRMAKAWETDEGDRKMYKFYGSDTPAIAPVSSDCNVRDQRHMYDIMSKVWCAETCAPRMRKNWTKENMTLGQCSITSFLVQDIFGGIVYGIPLPEGGYHCYNEVNGVVFDLTSEQFGDEKLCYENNPIQTRETHFADADKLARYELLKAEFEKQVL